MTASAPQKFEHFEECMGTVFRFAGRSDLNQTELAARLSEACEVLHQADRIFSLYKPESPLSRLARGEVRVADLEPVVAEVWDACEQWSNETDGWFSAFTPERTFDPSGLVKTWAANQAAQVLLAAGQTDFTFNAGGDVFIAPGASEASDWRIAISTPVSIASAEAGVLTVLDLAETGFCALATSGSAERGEHIWNPKTYDFASAGQGFSADEKIVQVSVVAADLVEADVLATAAYAEGIRAIERLNARPNVEAIFVSDRGQFAATDGFLNLLAK
jgi:thiamine biosynthesis lipoprotein